MAGKVDRNALWLPGPGAALDELRARARSRIASGDKEGRDLRAARIRLSDETGSVLFEGTLGEAAGEGTLPAGRPDAARLH